MKRVAEFNLRSAERAASDSVRSLKNDFEIMFAAAERDDWGAVASMAFNTATYVAILAMHAGRARELSALLESWDEE